ncbi:MULTISPECIES: site-2 protease family protein [Micromonospora]|uniref:Zn-dependent protease (Includes SpoIVFB) n=1 Tax=Micromonospora yangpuensis TaxID=683228 RepID=A0A1C6V1D5_9ACTN|nr:site-2 protease family protein [Micromonospora yangpuensis]GGL97221.1 site-2 protease family protein [Micromonospora yangpuensis]SCL59934.1 Zn-dependent protease (includes SpoIVFB) [Micromonospora yangpuensis]
MAYDRPGDEALVLGVPRAARRPSPIFLALVAIFVACAVLAWHQVGNVRLAVFGFVVSGWLVSLCLHEYAHAVVAFRAGDRSVAHRGYLTLNPFKYTHPLLSVVLPVAVVLLGGIGLPGGAVWVDRHAIPGRLRHTLVSLAGPATNVLFTLVLVVVLRIGTGTGGSIEFWAGWALLAFLQLTASVLNLLPVPGLDGGNMLQPWLNPQWRRMYDLFAPFGFILLFALLWNPRIGGWFFDAVFALADLLGLPPWLYATGLDLIRFWQS